MTDRTCNGWTNHATWLINVWTDGDDEIARISHPSNGSVYERARALKEYIAECYLNGEDAKSSLTSDIISSALAAVDWYELVQHYEDCEDNTEDEDNDA